MTLDFVGLHPYQYVYYNELAGSFPYVTSRYESDYWSASYKEGAQFLRTVAQNNTDRLNVYTCNIAFGVDYYSHKLFNLVNDSSQADYVICDNKNARINGYNHSNNIVFKVVRKGAVLSYVAKVKN